MKEQNYKQCLLGFYWLMSSADGKVSFASDDPEWKMLGRMCKIEDIDKSELELYRTNKKGTEEEQLTCLLTQLVILSHSQRTRALAWMDLVMFADGYIHENELRLFEEVREKFDIEEEDINAVKAVLIDEISYTY